MSKIIERCAGIDVGKRFLLCSVLTGAAQDDPVSQTRRFDTDVPDLEEMCEWLKQEAVTHVVMESTGSYWIPVFNLLEGHFTIVLANPEEGCSFAYFCCCNGKCVARCCSCRHICAGACKGSSLVCGRSMHGVAASPVLAFLDCGQLRASGELPGV
jgi:hypothetical protein